VSEAACSEASALRKPENGAFRGRDRATPENGTFRERDPTGLLRPEGHNPWM